MATGAKAKNNLIFFAKLGIVEKAMKAVKNMTTASERFGGTSLS